MTQRQILGFALLALFLPTSCGDDKPAAKADDAQRRERVEITRRYPPDSPADDLRNTRTSVTRIVSGLNDAVTAPFPGRLSVDLPATNEDSFAGSLCLTGFPADKTPPRVRLYFEIDFVGAKETRKHSVTLSFTEAVLGWSPMQFVRGGTDATKLTIRGSYIGEDVPGDIPGLRMALALPATELLKAPVGEAPNVLLISIDTLRADHMSCYGYERETTPNIDALVKRGVLFERAFSPAPWTLPAYGSLFTALLPADHRAGIVTEREAAWGSDVAPPKRTTEVLRNDVPTLAELMTRRGYQTAGFVSNPFLGPLSGVARGFQSYTSYQYNAQTGADLALEWINSRPGARWFVFLHVIDPHMPYAPPKPYDTRFSKIGVDEIPDWPPDLDTLRRQPPSDETKQRCVDFYDGEIAFVDAQIDRLLDALDAAGTLENTLVILHSDHGEEFWEHGSCDHGHTQFEELLHVPLAFVWPKKLGVKRIATRVRTLDVLPTIAEIVGFDVPAGIEGRSLMSVIDGRETTDRDGIAEALMHTQRETKALYRGKDKLIATGAAQNLLFDLGADPRELYDLSAESAARVDAMRKLLLEHHEKAKASASRSTPFQPDRSVRDRIHRYGYVGDGQPPPPKK
ncbi:MAG: sulfatase [Planctomycetes bacterium]|nr:sulfatase [Planctomycetota bacterium]